MHVSPAFPWRTYRYCVLSCCYVENKRVPVFLTVTDTERLFFAVKKVDNTDQQWPARTVVVFMVMSRCVEAVQCRESTNFAMKLSWCSVHVFVKWDGLSVSCLMHEGDREHGAVSERLALCCWRADSTSSCIIRHVCICYSSLIHLTINNYSLKTVSSYLVITHDVTFGINYCDIMICCLLTYSRLDMIVYDRSWKSISLSSVSGWLWM